MSHPISSGTEPVHCWLTDCKVLFTEPVAMCQALAICRFHNNFCSGNHNFYRQLYSTTKNFTHFNEALVVLFLPKKLIIMSLSYYKSVLYLVFKHNVVFFIYKCIQLISRKMQEVLYLIRSSSHCTHTFLLLFIAVHHSKAATGYVAA